MGCVPVDPSEFEPALREQYLTGIRAMVAAGDAAPSIYPGSTYTTCEVCGIRIAVGPRQQAITEAAARFHVQIRMLCLPHAAIHQAMTRAEVQNLGNPYTRKPE